jgi:putative cell wall-binding protein
MRTSPIGRQIALLLAVALATAVLLVVPDGADAVDTETADTLRIVKDDEAPSPSELAVRLSEDTPMPASGTVLIGRSDVFADSLASGVLQGASPLLLVPPQGPIPDRVLQELARLAPARVLLLGGVTAIGQVVEDQLAASYAVERRAGTSRIETAIEIARADAPAADSAILARAFPTADADDPTQAFADALAAGGLAAEEGWPVLLTQTDRLTGATRDYLAASGIRTMYVAGGTAAISEGVIGELQALGITAQRVAGDTRAETAIEVAMLRGAETAADVDRVTVVEGQGEDAWAAGFAAAAHSAFFDAPIVLTAGEALPPETEAFLQGGAGAAAGFAQTGEGVRITCVTGPVACEESRVAIGLPPAAVVTFDPPTATDLAPSQQVSATVEVPPAYAQTEPAEGEIVMSGDCLDAPVTGSLAEGTVTATASANLPVPCTISVSLLLEGGTSQTTTAIYPGGIISGTVRSATDGTPVAGAAVAVSDGSTTTSGPDGTFTVGDLEPGQYRVTAEAEGFQPSAPVAVTVQAAQTSPVDVLLSTVLQAGALRAVLTWDDNPSDLDSHLWLPASQPWHIFYGDRGSLDACPFANLDIDDVSGFGPETITIGQALPGVYRYGVHNFSGGETLSQSNAIVQVFDSVGLVATFEVPQNGTSAETWWHVFDVDVGAATLTPFNRLVPGLAEVQPYAESNSC